MLRRRGATLVELLVGLTLASVVLGSATASVLRQQRTHARIASVSGADAQRRAAISVLASQLALLDPTGGDLTAGEAADSAFQFRALIAASVACDQSVGSATFLPDPSGTVSLGGEASLPHTGDSLWWYGDSTWSGDRINGVSTVPASCSAPIASAGPALRVTIASSPDSIRAGTAIRVTRQTRYGVYRASDGTWQLGFREWNDPTGAFSAPQPVAGPLMLRSNGRSSGFRYFDNAGHELSPASGTMNVTSVSLVRITTQSLVATRNQGQDSVRTDSVDVALRNARTP
ncbi:MAG: prepilin-type N-terminal cleavage/methylation domain-containing protein [bacterium]